MMIGKCWRLCCLPPPPPLHALRLQAVAVEAGMLALRRGGTELKHEDYVEGITVVQAKKKASLNYYA